MPEPIVLKDLFVVPDFDRARAVVTFTAPPGLAGGRWTITAPSEKGDNLTVASGSLAVAGDPVRFETALPDFTPWTLDNPFLYRLTLVLALGAEEQRVVQDFGMRKFHVADKQIFMNNEPLYVRGVIRGREAHDHANLAGLPEVEFYAKFIRAARQLGFNFIRFHSRVPSDAYFEAADRLGILTHVEVRKYYGKYQKERELMDHDPVLVRRDDWIETILHIRNHPSLMVYCLGNEINKPGRNPEVKERAAELRALDPTRLFIDTCARGEYDRTGIDLDVQHMGYFAPFGRNYHMFDTTDNWAIFGSVEGKEMVVRSTPEKGTSPFSAQHPSGRLGREKRNVPFSGEPLAVTRRAVPVNVPVLAHEVGHYVALRDLEALRRKFADAKAEEPWWISELLKLRRLKGLDRDYPRLLEASIRYQSVWYKQVFESIRKSPILRGFNFLQLADTERYENANGLLDCFDDLKPAVQVDEYLKFNGDAIIVADLPRRTFFEGETVTLPLFLSNFSNDLRGEGTLEWSIGGTGVALSGRLDRADLPAGLHRVATLQVGFPECAKPRALTLSVSIQNLKSKIQNSWSLWLYPNRPETLAVHQAEIALRDINLFKRYAAALRQSKNRNPKSRILITDRFTDAVFRHLERGGDVLMLYRVPETRDRSAARERYYMPSTWDRFKGVIWDRGHNLGGFLRRHPAVAAFPTNGFIDFQFAGLIDDCDKFSLDGFPVAVAPIIQGADKASRDRYDVYTFQLRELQPDWTMRKFAYLFDLQVGRGRLMMSAFNLTGLERDVPEACAMFESLCACVAGKTWKPKSAISVADLKAYLADCGRRPRIKERMMTQYWQFDAEPLESAQYWKDAEAWIRQP
jgi:hypothetical protein